MNEEMVNFVKEKWIEEGMIRVKCKYKTAENLYCSGTTPFPCWRFIQCSAPVNWVKWTKFLIYHAHLIEVKDE